MAKTVVLAQWFHLKNLLMFRILLCYFTLEMFDFNLKLGQDLVDI